jgi:hypothetical protein
MLQVAATRRQLAATDSAAAAAAQWLQLLQVTTTDSTAATATASAPSTAAAATAASATAASATTASANAAVTAAALAASLAALAATANASLPFPEEEALSLPGTSLTSLNASLANAASAAGGPHAVSEGEGEGAARGDAASALQELGVQLHAAAPPAQHACVCHGEFTGEGCETPLFSCPLNCSGVGLCLADPKEPTSPQPQASERRGQQAREEAREEALGPLSQGYRGGADAWRERQATAKCHCSRGYAGAGCERAQPQCPDDCGGRGQCVRSRKVVEGAGGLSNVSVEVSEARCECVKGWGGANCSAACPDTCHQRGRCVLTSADLAPQGMALRLDTALEMATQADAHDALFAARHRRAQRAQCLCDAGYEGASCGEIASCPRGCSGNGACALGICSCDLGWDGDACDVDGRGWQLETSSCPNHCSGNGRCEAGRCACLPGFHADDCSASGTEPQSSAWAGPGLALDRPAAAAAPAAVPAPAPSPAAAALSPAASPAALIRPFGEAARSDAATESMTARWLASQQGGGHARGYSAAARRYGSVFAALGTDTEAAREAAAAARAEAVAREAARVAHAAGLVEVEAPPAPAVRRPANPLAAGDGALATGARQAARFQRLLLDTRAAAAAETAQRASAQAAAEEEAARRRPMPRSARPLGASYAESYQSMAAQQAEQAAQRMGFMSQ